MSKLKKLSLITISALITLSCSIEDELVNPINTIESSQTSSNSRSYVDINKSNIFKGSQIQKTSSNSIKTFNNIDTNFKFKSKQWHLRDTDTISAWEKTTGNKDLIVAVIDSGVDYNHPDLKNRVIKGPDFADQDSDPMDEGGHGTHVAGIIAASGSVKGLAPNIKIMALKVFPSGENKNNYNVSEGIADAILYATENGASIINMSLGSPSLMSSNSRAIESAINEAVGKGLIVVTAAGNDAYGSVSSQPSVQSNINQIPVIATDEMKKISTFSTYSNLDHPKAISAPGVNIYSTMPVAMACNKKLCEMPYQYMDGTSMASPVIAGTLALIESAMYDDYVRVIKELQKIYPDTPILTFKDFFHTKQKSAMSMLGISIPPARLAEQLLFSYTNKDNSYSQNPRSMIYGALRDPVFGFGIVNAGSATKAASEVFSSVYLK